MVAHLNIHFCSGGLQSFERSRPHLEGTKLRFLQMRQTVDSVKRYQLLDHLTTNYSEENTQDMQKQIKRNNQLCLIVGICSVLARTFTLCRVSSGVIIPIWLSHPFCIRKSRWSIYGVWQHKVPSIMVYSYNGYLRSMIWKTCLVLWACINGCSWTMIVMCWFWKFHLNLFYYTCQTCKCTRKNWRTWKYSVEVTKENVLQLLQVFGVYNTIGYMIPMERLKYGIFQGYIYQQYILFIKSKIAWPAIRWNTSFLFLCLNCKYHMILNIKYETVLSNL